MQIKDVKSFDQQMSFVFHAIIAGPLLLYSITYLRTIDGAVIPSYTETPLMLKAFVSFFSGLLVLLGFLFLRNGLRKARGMDTLREKLQRLFQVTLIHYAFLEFASFISVIAFFLTHEHLFTAVYVAILFLMSLNRPLPEKYANDLLLKGQEREIVLEKKPLKD